MLRVTALTRRLPAVLVPPSDRASRYHRGAARCASWLAPLAVLLTLGLLAFGPLIEARPSYGDNLLYLSYIAGADLASIVVGGFTYFPAYRPLPMATLWAQYRLVELDWIESYFLANIGLLVLCAALVGAFVRALAGSLAAGSVVALAMLLDDRSRYAIEIIAERQSPIAGLFGLAALLVALAGRGRPRRAGTSIVVFLLLLASALSKEYGLAFAGAVVVAALLEGGSGRRALVIAANLAVVVYGCMRLLLAEGATTGVCENAKFWTTACDPAAGVVARTWPYVWNALATFVGTALPALFTSSGAPRDDLESIDWLALAVQIVWLLLALVAWLKLPRRTLPLLALIALNAGLNFLLYRTRNHFFGMIGLYATAGFGLAYFLAADGRRGARRWIAAIAIAALVGWEGRQVPATIRYAGYEATIAAQRDPCATLRGNPDWIDRDVVRRLKIKYGMSDPDCAT